MPDETLQSRITRYHYLSGNKTELDTFQDLFGTPRFAFNIIPKQIEYLAARLPGNKGENIRELLTTNTIFPAYQPFVGLTKAAAEDADDNVISLAARIPRREVSAHTMAKICLSCVEADLTETGCSYWHRAHHIPGVTACWRHGEALLQACPNCSHPFYRKLKLLPSLTAGCLCGWSPLSSYAAQPVPEIEREFALFAKELLHRNLPSIDCQILTSVYCRQARKLSFRHGQFIATKKLFDSIRSKYGDDLLSKIDRAFAAGKYHQWIRVSTIQGQLDMPIARHLIISYYLFGNVENFEKCIVNESLIYNSAPASPSPKIKATPTNKQKQYRDRVSQLKEARSDLSLEYLWAKAYQITLWLITNDKEWLLDKLSSGTQKKAEIERRADIRDQKYADIIKVGAEELYKIAQKKPIRVNFSNMLALLPTPVRLSPDVRRAVFPLVAQQLELHLESLWHFRLRRAIWALSEMARLKLVPNTKSLNLITSMPSPAWQAIVNYLEWDLGKLMSEGVDAEVQLDRANVSRQWEGPPGCHLPMGGRSYVPIRETAPL